MAVVRFLFDEHLSNDLVREVRRFGIDVLTAAEAGLLKHPDEDYIALGIATGRVVVTFDRGFIRRHEAGEYHVGIVYCKPGSRTYGQLIEYLRLVYEVCDAEEMIGSLERL